MKYAITALSIIIFTLSATTTKADIILFDIDSDPGGWSTGVAGLTPTTAYNFDNDADYGINGFDGPLTSAGGGPVSAGILSDGVTMDRINLGGGSPGLVAIGPLAGFGNLSNAMAANFFVDGFSILFSDPVLAFAFDALTLLGGSTVNITAYDNFGGTMVFNNITVGANSNLGLLGILGQQIVQVDIFDPSGGAEGVQGIGTVYDNNARVPEPTTVLLMSLGLAGLGVAQRRRLNA